MGKGIDHTDFTDEDRSRFAAKLESNLVVLRQLLARPRFGIGPRSVGAELELYIVDEHGRPLPANTEILDKACDKRLTLELNRYNLEANLTPCLVDDSPFRTLEQEMLEIMAMLDKVAAGHGGRVLPIGILPTLVAEDLAADMLTPEDRYRALMRELRKRRQERFHIELQGLESLSIKTDLVTCEGANTSLQIHYRVNPDRFAALYNTIQLITPLAVGLGANSPIFLGRRLWHETRIPLFRQAIDGRNMRRRRLNMPERVHFGHGWLRHDVFELFAEVVCLYRTILPDVDDEDPAAVFERGGTPGLHELQMHAGTVWPWNRAVYDHHDGGHLRIEMRSLAAGPTCVDMVANAAFLIGLAEGLVSRIDAILPAMPYRSLEQNLEMAARFGISANLLWPSLKRLDLEEHSLTSIVDALLPVAADGLASIGIASDEIEHYLTPIQQRLAACQNGASWQLAQLERLPVRLSREAATRRMLALYTERSSANMPVAEWTLETG